MTVEVVLSALQLLQGKDVSIFFKFFLNFAVSAVSSKTFFIETDTFLLRVSDNE